MYMADMKATMSAAPQRAVPLTGMILPAGKGNQVSAVFADFAISTRFDVTYLSIPGPPKGISDVEYVYNIGILHNNTRYANCAFDSL